MYVNNTMKPIWVVYANKNFLKEEIQVAKKYMKISPISLILKEGKVEEE
jgi:hypothetical protein